MTSLISAVGVTDRVISAVGVIEPRYQYCRGCFNLQVPVFSPLLPSDMATAIQYVGFVTCAFLLVTLILSVTSLGLPQWTWESYQDLSASYGLFQYCNVTERHTECIGKTNLHIKYICNICFSEISWLGRMGC